MKYPETHSIQELGRIDTAAHTGAVDLVTTHMGYTKQNVTNTEAIMVMLGGAAIQMRTAQSISATVEENAFQQFSISIMDVDSGSVSADNINITGISAVIEKSTGGGAFSAAGLTAMSFSKTDGRVYQDYQFKAAEWTVGDVYKIVVTGIEATVGGDTAYVPAMVWSNFIVEHGDVKTAVDSLVAGVGLDGSVPSSYDYSKGRLSGWLHGFHMIRRILFVIPEAVGSITAHNTAILAELDKLGLVQTITQADALTYPDYESITLIVLGSPLAGTAWTTSNLAHVKSIYGLPVVCVDGIAAAYLQMGGDGGNAATKTVLNAVANVEGSILGMGIDDTVGLAAGANTVADSGVTFATLDMSDADITEIWYGWETAEANTDVLLSEIRKTMPDGTVGVDADGDEVPGTLAFYGCAYSMGGLNALGAAVFHLLVEKLLHSSTAGQTTILSGNIGNLASVIGRKNTAAATGDVSNAKTMMAYVKQAVTELLALATVDDTTFSQETAGATDSNGTTWVDLLDKSTITSITKICGFKLTVAGSWAGKAKMRITDGDGNKIFPFGDELIQDTDWASGAQETFTVPIDVLVATGYKIQIRSTEAADGAGETVALTNLDIIELG